MAKVLWNSADFLTSQRNAAPSKCSGAFTLIDSEPSAPFTKVTHGKIILLWNVCKLGPGDGSEEHEQFRMRMSLLGWNSALSCKIHHHRRQMLWIFYIINLFTFYAILNVLFWPLIKYALRLFKYGGWMQLKSQRVRQQENRHTLSVNQQQNTSSAILNIFPNIFFWCQKMLNIIWENLSFHFQFNFPSSSLLDQSPCTSSQFKLQTFLSLLSMMADVQRSLNMLLMATFVCFVLVFFYFILFFASYLGLHSGAPLGQVPLEVGNNSPATLQGKLDKSNQYIDVWMENNISVYEREHD